MKIGDEMEIKEEKKAIKNLKASYMEDWDLTEDQKDDLDALVYRVLMVGKEEGKQQATPEGFVLDAPARVGGGVFHEGVKWKTVIESAQRLYEYSKDEIKPIVSPADMLKIANGELVLVPKEKIGSLVGELHTAFQSTPTLTLGDLLPLQQDFQAMIEAQEQSHD